MRATLFRSLHVRNMRLFLAGQLAKLVGLWMLFIAQDWLVLDLTGTQYLSSAGLRILLLTAKQIERASGRFVLHGVCDRVRDVLDLSGFLSELKVCSDRTEALAIAGA